jgi:predicted MFS family arabinose efflux permease
MHRRVGLLLFAAGWGANHFSTLLVVYRRELGLSPSALGILFGAYALGLVPGLILAGRASDRWGRRALVIPASLVALVASAVVSFGGAHGFGVLMAGRLLYGLGMGSAMSPGSVWLQELSPAGTGARRATLALSAGFGLGPLVAGVLAEFAPAPMVLPYIVHIVVMTAALLGTRAVPETAIGARGGAAARTRWRDLAVLVELLPVAPWAFGLAAATMVVLPGLLRSMVARPVLYSGTIILATLGAGVLVQPYVKRVGRHADLLGLAVGALGVWLGARVVASGSPPLALLAAPLAGLGYGLAMTSGLAEVAARVPAQARGTAVGIYYVLTYVGFSVPFVHATVAKRWGDVPTLEVTAAAVLVSLVARALTKLRRPAA